MKDIIFNYLNKHYNMSYDDYLGGYITDKRSNDKITIIDLIKLVHPIFHINNPDTQWKIIEEWRDSKELEFIMSEMKQSK